MRKRLFLFLTLLTLILVFMTMAMVHFSTSNITTSARAASPLHHKAHFLTKKGLQRYNATNATPTPLSSGFDLFYGGGPVMSGTMNVYAIFWEPTGTVAANYNSLIERYFGDVGGSPLYHNLTQYPDSSGNFPSNAVLAGSWVDTSAYPKNPLLDSDVQNEVTNAQKVNGWSSSIDNAFFVFTGAGENICYDSTFSQCASNTFCAYHDFFGTDTIYAAMPYAPSFGCTTNYSPNNDVADQAINLTSHEQMEAATDPLVNAWADADGQEIGDKCAWMFGPLDANGGNVNWNGNEYAVQQEWDNNVSGCVLSGP